MHADAYPVMVFVSNPETRQRRSWHVSTAIMLMDRIEPITFDNADYI